MSVDDNEAIPGQTATNSVHVPDSPHGLQKRRVTHPCTKHPSRRKSRRVSLRFTEREYRKLADGAQAAQMSVSDYIAHRATGRRLQYAR